jgi:CIC family chloride channel protein
LTKSKVRATSKGTANMKYSGGIRPVFRESSRGYELIVGRFRLPQSTYLLLAAVVVGVGGGYGAVAFRALIGGATSIATWLTALMTPFLGPVALVASIGCGGAAAAWFAARFAPEARGHGVPEVMAAVALHGGVIRPRIILIKALASATTIGFGGAAGREGPIVQIGSAIGSLLGQVVRAPAPIVRTLVACGAAAGISATFNAPIGGVFFASEVILGDFAPRSFAVIVVASVVSAVIGRSVLGNRPSFDASAFSLVSPRELWLYALLGIVCALGAAAFVKVLYAFEDAADRIKAPAWIKGFAGFALVGAIGLAVPQILGVGYGAMQHVLDGHVDFARAFSMGLLKPLATSITLASGGSGGVFAPSLFTGAMFGDAFGRVVHTVFPAWTAAPAAYGLVAMAAFFAAASEAPITAITIVFEMSDDYTIILPLMIATVVAAVLGRRLINGTVYELKLMRRGIDWKRVRRPHALAHINLHSVLVSEPAIVAPDAPLAGIAHAMAGPAGVAIVVDDGMLVGVVTAAAFAAALLADPNATAAAAMGPPPPPLHASDSLERAADLFGDPNLAFIPVLDDEEHFAGTLTRHDVLDAYRSVRAG